jgi:PIN domain nuclease of toxin-antitoxin system
MSVSVLDACAMIAYLKDEEGAENVQAILEDPDVQCITHTVNLIEVHKLYAKTESILAAEEAIQILLRDTGIVERSDMDESFWKMVSATWAKIASTVKNPLTGGCHRIALADSFAIAIAIRMDGAVVTSDEHFVHVKDTGICKVVFFRPPGKRYVYTGNT